jgi:hypothetical protein
MRTRPRAQKLPLAVFLLFAQFIVSGHAQSGRAAPQTAPTSAKSLVCKGRSIPQLEDVTKKVGVDFRHVSAPDKKYIIESMSAGVLLLDYDRDGWLDIYFTNSPTVDMALKGEKSRSALYHNNHDGTFSDVTDKAGVASPCFAFGGAVADVDNDGWPDMYITCFGGNVLYHNNGDGTFADVTKKAGVREGRWSTGAAFADYDGDGFVDLAVANYVDFHFDDLPLFGSSPTCTYRSLAVQCGPRGLKGAGDSLFHNNGDGTFTDVSKQSGAYDPAGYYGMGVMWADFNNTGKPDLYVANDSTPNFLYRNDGNGKFTEIGLESGTAVSEDGSEQGSMGVTIGDYNHTGRQSIYVTNFANEYNTLYRNDGDWNFQDASYKSGLALPSLDGVKWGTSFLDLDNDGWIDLVVVAGHVYPQVDQLNAQGGYRQARTLSMNQGDGTFCDASQQAGSTLTEKRVSRGVAVGDLFNDGNMDIVINDLDGPPSVLRNPGIPGRHWIAFELAGTKSNRMAIGARIKVKAAGMVQTDEIHSGNSYLSQNDMRLHFGLANAKTVEEVEIRWPSGKVETLKDLAADKLYPVLEGSGVVAPEQIRPGAKNAPSKPTKQSGHFAACEAALPALSPVISIDQIAAGRMYMLARYILSVPQASGVRNQ